MSKRSLLLADDSITIQKVISLTFTDEGYDVRTFGDGDSAMESIRSAPPDIVLADVNMPGSDGYEICQSLRSDDATRHIPTILLVGSFEPFDRDRAESVGANSFLTKPFQSIRQLVDQVNELVMNSQSAVAMSENFEAIAEPTPAKNDIESLYDQSLAHDQAGTVSGFQAFEEPALDDEMIETSYVAGLDTTDTLDFELVNTDDGTTSVSSEAAPAPGSQYPAEETTSFDASGFAESDQRPTESLVDPFGTQPLGEIAGFSRGSEFDERTFDISTDLTQDIPNSQPSDAYPETEPLPQMGIETVSFDAPEPAVRDIEETDLLELPPVGPNQTIELTTAERAELMGSGKQIVSLSPELIDTIVEKVVQRLSHKY
ncbi:PleD family two-component system response regulator [Leptolyngbya sp. 7M]|uniref:response regulator n=1 Tax=Leptolyngbya sp. 7M TaxID=2812896 RepID=UPI001B8CC59B|nr:response regulator [Leptolyngbya sp. 7M]QYO66649.1 response regulator [Leptolyngbya sp. 7M]